MSFFKAYDMRGTFGTDFDLDTVYRVGLALPQVVKGRRWLIGRDGRNTSVAIREALWRGLEASGAEVTDLGLCTTPMVYFFTAQDDFDGSVMITASHNPPGDNGLKVSMRTALPVGYANGLNEVERLVQLAGTVPEGLTGTVPTILDLMGTVPEYLARYVEWQRGQTPEVKGLRYAVDCSNGSAAILAEKLFSGAKILNNAVDGNFPAHSPNPLNAEARRQLAEVVIAEKLDCGVIFDGDADRCMFIDERGEFVQPDYLIPIVVSGDRPLTGGDSPREVGGDSPREAPVVIHDVRTSRGAIEAIEAMGMRPVMVPVGHAFAKPLLRQYQAVGGGELAGHYYFRDFFGCDSGVLAARRILNVIAQAKREGRTFSQLMAPISTKYANSGELNFKVADKAAAIVRVLKVAESELMPKGAGPGPEKITLDGVRLECPEGWINVRPSNTEPYLRLIVECDTPERLRAWTERLQRELR